MINKLNYVWLGFSKRVCLTPSYTDFRRLVLHGAAGREGGNKVPAAFFSETVKPTVIKLDILTN